VSEETMSRIYLKIPVERAGALIGEKGGTKVELEKGTGSSIEVDGATGEVVIEMDASSGTRDPSGVLKARDIVNAIGRGFSPERAFRLFTDGQMLEVIDLKAGARRVEEPAAEDKGQDHRRGRQDATG